MPPSSYMPVHFPTYFNLCLAVAHITLNCALCNSARKSLSVIFGVWMCPWGVVRMCACVCMCQTGLFILLLSVITYCIQEEAAVFTQHSGQFLSDWAFPSFRRAKKKNALWQYHRLAFLLSPLGFRECVTDMFGLEPAQFAKQVILLCS